MVLTAHFPTLKEFAGSTIDHPVNLSRFPFEVVKTVIDFAYTGRLPLSQQIGTRLYLLGYNLRNQTLIDWCITYLKKNIDTENALEIWSAANITMNQEFLHETAPHIMINWELFRVNRLFLENSEVAGMEILLKSPQIAMIKPTSKVETILEWIKSSKSFPVKSERKAALYPFLNCIASELSVRDVYDLLINMDNSECYEDLRSDYLLSKYSHFRIYLMDILREIKTPPPQIINSRFRERIGVIEVENRCTILKMYHPDNFVMVSKFRLRDRVCFNVVPFHNKIVFLGGTNDHGPVNSVDALDPSTGMLLELPRMKHPRNVIRCVANDKCIFALGYNAAIPSEFYDSDSKSWSELPPMRVERWSYGTTYVSSMGVLVVGGRQIGYTEGMRDVELLRNIPDIQLGKNVWQWDVMPPLNQKMKTPHIIGLFSRIFAVDQGQSLNDIEMIDFSSRKKQWTILTHFIPWKYSSLQIGDFARIADHIYFTNANTNDLYVGKLEDKQLSRLKHIKNIKASLVKLIPLRFSPSKRLNSVS